MRVRQARGKKHLKLIKRRAMRLWMKNKCQYGLWDHCLKITIENHRKSIQEEIVSKIRDQQAEFQCDVNGWIG